ncbi:MAG: zinc ribbon domain-containing protein [Planctomycetaceae bacterium]|nr:zinc ribbon domain-containing protein [Planctomycetaceae bacterium]
MPPRIIESDEFDDDDWQLDSDEFDGAPQNDDATMPCPYCRRDIPEDTPRCPYCENYLSEEDAPPQRKPWWILAGIIVCLYIVYRWMAG